MACTTRCCPKYLGRYCATATASGNNLVVELADVCSPEIIQGDKISFYIGQCFDYPQTKIGNVLVKINGTSFTAIKIGNVKWDTIKKRVCYTGIIGTEAPTITIQTELPCSKFDYPVYKTNCSTFEKVGG